MIHGCYTYFMTRHETLEGINKRLGKMDKEKLERLLKFIDQIEVENPDEDGTERSEDFQPRKADKLSASGLPYTGDPETDEVLDDPELTKRLLEHKATFEGLTPKQVASKRKKMEASGELIPWEKVKAELGL
jgi:hypothetical protein